jgi:hypothetical protein
MNESRSPMSTLSGPQRNRVFQWWVDVFLRGLIVLPLVLASDDPFWVLLLWAVWMGFWIETWARWTR